MGWAAPRLGKGLVSRPSGFFFDSDPGEGCQAPGLPRALSETGSDTTRCFGLPLAGVPGPDSSGITGERFRGFRSGIHTCHYRIERGNNHTGLTKPQGFHSTQARKGTETSGLASSGCPQLGL